MTTAAERVPPEGTGRLSGRRLGAYDVLQLIGAGGMGEVYRARDPRLNRDVAIKVLPACVAADADALARFRREARAIAALSHPNILAIFEFNVDEGVAYAVTELLAGETLRRRLARGPLPAREASGIAIQIAEGLAGAHAHGVIHRDLKPENIFLTTAGVVKILDFGLARIADDALSPDSAATQSGTIMGTPGYMSPEQIRGSQAGPPSDIFAFGCVLHEMLLGVAPFTRSTVAETTAAILRDPPSSPSGQHAATMPPGVAAIAEHCLEKAPAARFQSAADMVFALRNAGAMSTSSHGDAGDENSRRARPFPGWPWLWGAAGLAVAFATVWMASRRPVLAPTERYVQLTYERGSISNARFSNDGRNVVFSAAWEGQRPRTFVKLPDSPDAVPTGPAGVELMSVSSSGELALHVQSTQISVFGYKGMLSRMPMLGGAVRDLKDSVVSADWVGGGESLAVITDFGDRQQLDCGAGMKPYDTRGWLSDLRAAPRGSLVAFVEHPSRDAGTGQLVVYDCRTGSRTELAPNRDHLGLAWHPDKSELWFGEYGGVRAVSLDGKERSVLQLPESVRVLDVGRDGRVLLAHESRRVRLVLRRLDEERVRDLSWLAWSLVLAFTPDGRQVLFTEFPQQGGDPIAALRGVDGSPVVRLGPGFVTSVSPDGRWAVAISNTPKPRSHLVLVPMGPGETRTLPAGPIEDFGMATFVPGGGQIVFIGRERGHGNRLYRQTLSGGAPVPLSPEGIRLSLLTVSPDGSLAAANWEGDRPWLFPVAGGEPRRVPSVRSGDVAAGWSADSTNIYVRGLAAEVTLRRVNLVDGSERTVAVVRLPDPSGVLWIGPMVVAPDERSVAFSYFRALSVLYVVTGLKDR